MFCPWRTAGTSINNTDEHTFFRCVAYCVLNVSYKLPKRSCNRPSKNLKHCGRSFQPSIVSAQAKEASCGSMNGYLFHWISFLTVGAHFPFDQQLGFSKSLPVYLLWGISSIDLNNGGQLHQVITASSGWPNPLRPLSALFSVPATMEIASPIGDDFLRWRKAASSGCSAPRLRPYLYGRSVTLAVCHPSRGSKT